MALAREEGLPVGAFRIDDVLQTEGANDRAQLATLAKEKNRRILRRWMEEGVTIIDPDTTWIDVDVKLDVPADKFSGSAKEKIEAAGGSATATSK